MAQIKAFVAQLLRDEEGASMVEYALLVALIAVVCIVGVKTLGTNAGAKFNTAAADLK